jgi:hypothetical protein
MSNPRYVTAHGKCILIETCDDIGLPARKTKRKGFASVELERAAHRAKAVGIPGAMVLVLLDYMAWKTESRTFQLTNALLARYGITRYTKYRTLMKLEKAGLIRVEHRNRQSLTVTLLDLLPGVPVA